LDAPPSPNTVPLWWFHHFFASGLRSSPPARSSISSELLRQPSSYPASSDPSISADGPKELRACRHRRGYGRAWLFPTLDIDLLFLQGTRPPRPPPNEIQRYHSPLLAGTLRSPHEAQSRDSQPRRMRAARSRTMLRIRDLVARLPITLAGDAEKTLNPPARKNPSLDWSIATPTELIENLGEITRMPVTTNCRTRFPSRAKCKSRPRRPARLQRSDQKLAALHLGHGKLSMRPRIRPLLARLVASGPPMPRSISRCRVR